MAENKLSWAMIRELILLIIQFILDGMSQKEAASKAAYQKGVSYGEAMKAWERFSKLNK